MPAATTVMAAATLAGAAQQANAQKEQGEYARMQAEENARMMEMQAADAIDRGDKAASVAKKKTMGVMADQRAILLARGVQADEGSSLSLQQETEVLGEEDERQIKNNAWREAWGLRSQARNTRASGGMAESAGKNAASMTLLTGAVRAGSMGYRGGGGKTTSDGGGGSGSTGVGPQNRELRSADI